MGLNIKDNITMEKNKEQVNLVGKMDQHMKANLKIIIYTEKVCINGLIKENMMASG